MARWSFAPYPSYWSALDLLFPPECAGSGKIGSGWCMECQKRVQVLRGTFCEVLCGLPFDQAVICTTCRADRPHFRAFRACAVFGDPLQTALHKLKYRPDISLAVALASHMLTFVRELNWPIDIIPPISLGKHRLKERGYNQAGMLAMPLALASNLKYRPGELMRSKDTRSQVGLTNVERRENVRKAFRTGLRLRSGIVLVMDGVSTTGSTLSESAEALYIPAAKDVFALTVARALPDHGLQLV